MPVVVNKGALAGKATWKSLRHIYMVNTTKIFYRRFCSSYFIHLRLWALIAGFL